MKWETVRVKVRMGSIIVGVGAIAVGGIQQITSCYSRVSHERRTIRQCEVDWLKANPSMQPMIDACIVERDYGASCIHQFMAVRGSSCE